MEYESAGRGAACNDNSPAGSPAGFLLATLSPQPIMFRMSRAWLLLLACALTPAGAGEAPDAALARFAVIEVAPVQTSIYVGRVTLAASAFLHRGSSFAASYSAKVFPFFFYSERGTLRIDLADEALRRLVGGATVDFSGSAVRTDGLERRVEGHATASGPAGGTLKVRLHLNRSVVLVFDTTYRLRAAPTPNGK